jgi:DNA primase (bacterial type)
MISNTKRSVLSITRDDVKLSDADIIKRYMGIDTFPCTFRSPLRDDDVNPSFSMRETLGKVYWKDFGTGESGSAVALMAKLWGVKYKEALLKIQLDTERRVPAFELIKRYKGKIHLTSNSTMDIKVREWRKWDTEFWKSFGISRKFCKWCNVFPVSHLFFTRIDADTGKKTTITIPADKYAYAYIEWKDNKESIKLYQPFSQTMKWLSKHDASVWDLWKQAFRWADKRSNEAVIITSSRKDAMCLWENLGVPAMALQGEGYLPKPQVMQQVFDKFKTVYLWYDNDFTHKNDNPGQDNAAKLVEMYPGLRNILIPSVYKSKDPSDLVKNVGAQALKELWEIQK